MTLLRTLIQPDFDDLHPSVRHQISDAANMLEIGEFQLLQLAHHEWFGYELAPEKMDDMFLYYMINQHVPYWAHHYAAQITRLYVSKRLDVNNPLYHRFDFNKSVRQDLKKQTVLITSFIITLIFLITVSMATINLEGTYSMFPPYLSDTELSQHPKHPSE